MPGQRDFEPHTDHHVKLRLRFLALLLLSLAAIAIGMWPSILTLGALIALPLGVIALAGMIRPSWVLESRVLRRVSEIGAALLVAEIAVLVAVVAWTPRRPVELRTRAPAPSRARIVYGVSDGEPRRWLRWTREFDVPANGMVYTRYAPDNGWYKATEMHPLRVTVQGGAGERQVAHGAWIGGGSARAGRCVVAYDDFSLAPSVTRAAASSVGADLIAAGPLDSLASWGLACRKGKLVRARKGSDASLVRSGPACYYDRTGVMTCGGVAVSAP